MSERRGLELDHHTVGLRVLIPGGTRSEQGPPVAGVIEGKVNNEFLVRFDEPQKIGATGFYTFNEVRVIE